MESHVLLRTEGAVRYVTLNNATKANSMSTSMIETLRETMKSADRDEMVTAVVLTANGKFFCTGMDFSAEEQPVGQRPSNEQELKYQQAVDLFAPVRKHQCMFQDDDRPGQRSMLWRWERAGLRLRHSHRSPICQVCPFRGQEGLDSGHNLALFGPRMGYLPCARSDDHWSDGHA